ncbi:MAG: hypothetical protein RIA65_03835 [Woeseia sp.]
MSSSSFEVSLQPDPALQRRVAAGGLAALVVGAVLIGLLPVEAGFRLGGVATWLWYSLAEIRSWHRSVGLLVRLRFAADGQLHGLFQNGLWQLLQVLPGSRITSRHAWLRLGNETCRVRGVLLSAKYVDAEDWRRLQAQLRFSR